MYFFDYDNMYEPYALYFQNYSEINWVAFIFLMGYFKEMKYIGKVSVTGIFFVLIVNTIQLHIGFSDTAYFVIYIGFIYLFLFIAYIWELFRYIEKSFER